MLYNSSRFAFIATFFLLSITISGTAIAAPTTNPIDPMKSADGIFAEYFQNIINNSCPGGQAVIGFTTTPVTDFGKPICTTISAASSFWTGDTTSIGYMGNVGIGTPTPGAKLDVVAGDARINGITVGLGGNNVNTNTALGNAALSANTSGSNNTANGMFALYSNTTGYNNTANGGYALYSNTTGNHNTANGFGSLSNTTTGYYNTANGGYALYNNNTGYYNTANGFQSLTNNTTGVNNTANGFGSLYSNTTGYFNTANGMHALYSNTTGYFNTANGYQSLYFNTTGNSNTANGMFALFSNTTGNYNTALGYSAGPTTGALTNTTTIGYGAQATVSNQVVLGNNSVTTTLLKGNVGIGTTNPINGKLEVNGAISTGAEGIRWRVFSGLTAAGTPFTSFLHGITESSIVSITGIVRNNIGRYIPPESSVATSWKYSVHSIGGRLYIYNLDPSMQGQPYKIIVQYQ